MSNTKRAPNTTAIRDTGFGFGLLPWAKGPLWRLNRAHKFTVDNNGFKHTYTIPEGYLFDGASIPPALWGFPFNYLPTGLVATAALEHDYLCDLYAGGSDWLRRIYGGNLPPAPPAKVIHQHFYEQLLADGVRPVKGFAMWSAVRLFGPGGLLRPSTIWNYLIAGSPP